MSNSPAVPGAPGLPTLSKLFVQGMPLDVLNAAQKAYLRSGPQTSFGQNFWSTLPKTHSDSGRDVFEVSLTIPQRINRVQFSLAHFPHRAWVQYYDATTKTWITLSQSNGLSAMITIEDSIPAIISPGTPVYHTQHPQHYGAEHWAKYDLKVNPVIASRLRIVMARIMNGNAPVNGFGNVMSYSLGVQDFQVGYIIQSQSDLPTTTRSSSTLTERDPIATTTDVLGSSVDYTVRENRASDLLSGTGIWKSGPQPIADAVVNLYVDARDSQGRPQVVDKFSLDPLHTGCTANVYYTLDVPDPGVFPASETPMTFPITRPYGATLPQPGPDGILFPATPGFLDIDNAAVQFNPTKPFQIHGMVQPQFPSSSTTPACFYDDGILSLSWGPDITGTTTSGAFTIKLGSMIAVLPGIPFAFNARFPFTVTYDGNTVSLAGPISVVTSLAGEVLSDAATPSVLRFGGSLTSDPTQSVPGNFRACSFMIKQGNPDDAEAQAAYWANPSAFTITPEYPKPGPQTTDNALLRYDPSQQTSGTDSINPYGLLGGPGVVYELLNWTPIARDYVLKKGYFEFDPTMARFFKFEFSNLAAEPYETSSPIVLTTQIFSGTNVTVPAVTSATAQTSNTGSSGTSVNASVANINRFSDQVGLTRSGSNAATPSTSTTYLPTEAYRVLDPQGAARMESAAPYWNFSKFQASPTMPRTTMAGQHYYETVSLPLTKRIAYFVGLKSITMYRVNRQLADDTDSYTELFHDDRDLVYTPSIATWGLNNNRITTTSFLAAPVQLMSKPYASFRTIQAVQFATTQSPPAQLLTDPDFDDQSLQFWQPIGDAAITPDPFYSTNIGSLVKVARSGNPLSWSSMENTYATWNLVEDSNPSPYQPTWDQLLASTSPTSRGGIQSFETINPSPIGKLYAAARVIAPAGLTAPLILKLVNGDGTILTQGPVNVLANQITEWSIEYDIGTGAPVAGNVLWSTQNNSMTWSAMSMMGTWNDVQQIPGTLAIRNVQVQLEQDEATNDVWYVDNVSIFNDAIMWEFSRDGGRTFWPAWDIRNDPNGVFIFPDGDHLSPGQGSQFVWRVTGAAPDLSVSALQVRFWFDSLMTGSPTTRTLQHGGPNLTPLDQHPNVADDPMFKAWHNAIPQDWWYIYRQWVRQHAATPAITQHGLLPDTLPVGVNEGSPAVPSTSIMPDAIVY